MMKGNKLLLSSVCGPFGEKYGDGFGVSYEGTHQIMWAQGIFRTRATTTQWGIDFIAENLKTPTITMHYPTLKKFIKEIKKGYDYIGIAFVSSTFHKMTPMVEAIRKYAPSSKIILGGYGTVLSDEELAPYADHICRGEGVAFMRELLGEPTDLPILQPDVTQSQSLFSIPLPGDTGYLFAGLGCPNGCDFCATSHYFKQKHICFMKNGADIVKGIHKMRDKHPGMYKFWISDEDFLLNPKRGKGYLESIRKSNLPPLSISVFSSVKALSQYEPAELVEMGIDWVWVGYEGKRAGYNKQNGKSYKQLFNELHDHGISVLASMIIGFEYQTPEIIEEEFEELMGLRPSMCQFLIYGPSRGTPLFKRMVDEGKLDQKMLSDLSKHDGFNLGFSHPQIGPEQMSDIQRRLYYEEFKRLGPAVFRVLDDWLAGHVNLKNHPAKRVREKAANLGEQAHNAMIMLPASTKYTEDQASAITMDLFKRLEQETGKMSFKQKVLAKTIAPAMMRFTDLKLKFNIGQQPEFSMRQYRTGQNLSLAIPKQKGYKLSGSVTHP
jgi:radical SAM superfamily enzyme YgiQ (UPF0313 family)